MNLREFVSDGVIIQGLTGRVGRVHVRRMLDYGTPLVAGVVPGRSGSRVEGIPVYDTVHEARAATGSRCSVAFLPPRAAADGLVEAAEAGIRLAVCVTEGLETHDALAALGEADVRGMRVIGPNSPGVLIPGELSLGFLPAHVARRGRCAVLARSGTLSYEVVWALTQAGLGQSMWIVVGGDRLKGTSFSDLIPQILADSETDALVLVGEVGGADEEDAAALLRTAPFPTVAIVAGRHAPSGRKMGHAGAIVAGDTGTYARKAAALVDAGVTVVDLPSEVPGALRRLANGEKAA
jgi:succinyl-CoA synthetase alpha subunit